MNIMWIKEQETLVVAYKGQRIYFSVTYLEEMHQISFKIQAPPQVRVDREEIYVQKKQRGQY